MSCSCAKFPELFSEKMIFQQILPTFHVSYVSPSLHHTMEIINVSAVRLSSVISASVSACSEQSLENASDGVDHINGPPSGISSTTCTKHCHQCPLYLSSIIIPKLYSKRNILIVAQGITRASMRFDIPSVDPCSSSSSVGVFSSPACAAGSLAGSSVSSVWLRWVFRSTKFPHSCINM